jgi:nicotinate-nucleotide adenylyltransferase
MRIGIFGGTFNPPHIGHVLSAMTAANQLDLDILLIVPTGVPPHKPLPAGTPSADIRLFVTIIAFWNVDRTVVSNIEVKNPLPSYTVDTVIKIKQLYPDSELFLLVGTDMFLTLETWKDYERLLSMVTPAVFFRGSEDRERIKSYSNTLKERYSVTSKTVINTAVQISSSKLREMLTKREGVRYIADTNYSYIIKNRLYGAKPNWNWLRERAYSMLNTERIPHVAGCEKEALQLAERWGVPLDDAREAAILHDITKRLGAHENVRILEDRGITVAELGNAGEKLLHPKTGAVLAKDIFGVSDDVANAIRWHTTGRAGMSVLEKVVYIADYIEPTRDLAGIGSLRELAYKDLDGAVKKGLEMTVEDIMSRGITPDRTTIDALNEYVV